MIKLHPSEIHFSQNFLPGDEAGSPSTILTSVNGLHLRSLPKLQVFKKSGCFFALDNNALLLYRDVEAGGGCGPVDVELVPAKIIPKAVMAATTCCTGASASNGSSKNVPVQKRLQSVDAEAGAVGAEPSAYSSESEEGTECEDSEDDCYDAIDDLTCIVCNRRFRGVQDLTSHQVNKKHFGCYACGDIYATSKELKQHKDAMRHYSDEEDSE